MALKRPVVFLYNILPRMYSIFGNKLVWHIEQLWLQEGIHLTLLPIINNDTSTISSRAEYIHREIESKYPNSHLVAYSMAGVDAAIAISKYGTPVRSLTTISSPHKGSCLAEFAGNVNVKYEHLEPLTRLLGMSAASFREYRPDVVNSMTQELKPRQDVELFSISAAKDPAQMNSMVSWGYDILQEKLEGIEVFNDGVVAVQEAQLGTHLMSFDGDHSDLIGRDLMCCGLVNRLIKDNLTLVESSK